MLPPRPPGVAHPWVHSASGQEPDPLLWTFSKVPGLPSWEELVLTAFSSPPPRICSTDVWKRRGSLPTPAPQTLPYIIKDVCTFTGQNSLSGNRPPEGRDHSSESTRQNSSGEDQTLSALLSSSPPRRPFSAGPSDSLSRRGPLPSIRPTLPPPHNREVFPKQLLPSSLHLLSFG